MNELPREIIEEVLRPRHENSTKCPEFELTTGCCMIKAKLSRPKIKYLGNTKGGRGRPQVYYNFLDSIDCPYLYTNEKCIYFDCPIYQTYKGHKCITRKDLDEAVKIISREVLKEYGVNPHMISADKIFKTIKTVKPSVTNELFNAFKAWLQISFGCIEDGGHVYLKLG